MSDRKFVVQYELPYVHTVMVGIKAGSPKEAKDRASKLFDAGEIWDDTPEVPLLYDDFDETGDAGVPLTFTVEQELAADEEWPAPACCVQEIKRREAAFEACRLLVDAYRRGEERGGSVDWGDLDQAYQMALQVSSSPTGPDDTGGDQYGRLAMVVEDESIQEMVSPGKDGAKIKALVSAHGGATTCIDLDEVFVKEGGVVS